VKPLAECGPSRLGLCDFTPARIIFSSGEEKYIRGGILYIREQARLSNTEPHKLDAAKRNAVARGLLVRNSYNRIRLVAERLCFSASG
jgi:hypothetical protein